MSDELKYKLSAIACWLVGLVVIYVVVMKLTLVTEVKNYATIRLICFYFMKFVLLIISFFLIWFGGNLYKIKKQD
jgi:uncharacterized Tic20 family protein